MLKKNALSIFYIYNSYLTRITGALSVYPKCGMLQTIYRFMRKVELQIFTSQQKKKSRKVACFLNVLWGKENTGLCLNSVIRHHHVYHSNLILMTEVERQREREKRMRVLIYVGNFLVGEKLGRI